MLQARTGFRFLQGHSALDFLYPICSRSNKAKRALRPLRGRSGKRIRITARHGPVAYVCNATATGRNGTQVWLLGVVAATRRDLEEMIDEKQFRSDLYYLLNVFPISIPALRERPEDIPLLVQHFAQQFSERMNETIDAIPFETMEALTRYSWPGNIRELQNVVERAVIVYEEGNLSIKKSWLVHECFHVEPATQSRFKRSAMEEREIVCVALAEARGRVSGPSGAAAKLGIPPSTLESKIRAMHINKYDFKASAETPSGSLFLQSVS